MLPANYNPIEDPDYMSPQMLEYFRLRLVALRQEIEGETAATRRTLVESGTTQHADSNDRATVETDRSLELRARDRQRKLVPKIDEALKRIADCSYGYCKDTDDEIGVRRLMARPTATLCLEAQERREKTKKNFAEDIPLPAVVRIRTNTP